MGCVAAEDHVSFRASLHSSLLHSSRSQRTMTGCLRDIVARTGLRFARPIADSQ